MESEGGLEKDKQDDRRVAAWRIAATDDHLSISHMFGK